MKYDYDATCVPLARSPQLAGCLGNPST